MPYSHEYGVRRSSIIALILFYLFHSMLPDRICISFNKTPTMEDFPAALLPTITVNTP